jgi:hypothetical protein
MSAGGRVPGRPGAPGAQASPARQDLHLRTSSRAPGGRRWCWRHSKTLAAQLHDEFKNLFPNAVEYFVALLRLLPAGGVRARTDTYIKKEAFINEHPAAANSATRICSSGT